MVLAFFCYWGFEGLVLKREGLASLCSLPLRTASPFPFARRDHFEGLASLCSLPLRTASPFPFARRGALAKNGFERRQP